MKNSLFPQVVIMFTLLAMLFLMLAGCFVALYVPYRLAEDYEKWTPEPLPTIWEWEPPS